MLKVIVIDDHELIRLATTSLVSKQKNIKVLGDAASAEEGLILVEKEMPDLVIIDIDLPAMDGISATEKIKQKYPDIKVIVLSRHDNSPYPERAFDAGADGYINKSASPDIIINAIEEVSDGGRYIDAFVAKNLIFKKKTVEHKLVQKLSKREQQVANLMVQGYTLEEIAKKLDIDIRTVFAHRTRIKSKLNVKGRGNDKLIAALNNNPF